MRDISLSLAALASAFSLSLLVQLQSQSFVSMYLSIFVVLGIEPWASSH